MDSYIKKFVYDALDIDEIIEYELREMFGFTFVFKKAITIINERISSAGIAPVGIIYDENGEYYYAALDDSGDIGEIVEKFAEEMVK